MRPRTASDRASATILTTLLLASALPAVAGAATFNVASGDTAGLIAAITAANANGEPDTIELAAGTYTFASAAAPSSALPSITSEIAIVGAGAGSTTIERANGSPSFHLLTVAGGELLLEGVTLHRGRGGILNNGDLVVRDCVFTAHDVALRNPGVAQIESSTVTGSTLDAIVNGGSLTLRDTEVVANATRAIDMTYGGRLRVIDSLIQGNQRGIWGSTGFPSTSLFIEIVRSTIDGNSQTGLRVGNFYQGAAARVIVTDSTISNNAGSGIVLDHSDERELIVRRSTISGNTTTGSGGGIWINGASVAPGGLASVLIDSSTISGNSAALSGGAIHLEAGLRLGRRITVVRSTITDNTADSDANGSGSGGGIFTPMPVVDLEDTILAGNVDTGGEAPDCSGPLSSRGHNLLGSTTGCSLALASSDATGAPLLGPLALNGGPTATHLPLAGSPALDAADPERCGAPDQRSLQRPVDGDADTVATCDVGAIEAGAATAIAYPNDHFLCYDVKLAAGSPALPAVSGLSLADDFESKSFGVKKTKALCTPTDASAEGVGDDATHLHAREINESPGEPRHLRQLGLRLATELGAFSVDTIKPDRLLVPASKGIGAPLPAPDALAHDVDRYKCYKARLSAGSPRLPRRAAASSAMLANQFTDGTAFVLNKLQRVCTAVDANGAGRKNPEAHALCFQVRTRPPLIDGSSVPTFAELFSTSEFGTEELATRRAYELCVPAVLLP